MGGERVPQPVRVGDDPPQRARVETPAARREEQGVVRATRAGAEGGTSRPGAIGSAGGASSQARPCLAQIAGEPERRLLAERHNALFAALAAADVHELLLEVDVAEVEADGL